MTRKVSVTVLRSGSQPVSRVLSRTIIHLGCMSPYTSCGLPGDNAGNIIAPLFGLAPGGVYHAVPVASHAVRSYRTISPLPGRSCRPGGIFSVALSVGSRRPGITWRPAHVEPGLSSDVTGLVDPGSHDSDCPADSHVHISPEWDDTPAIHTEAPEWRNSRGRLSNCMGVLYFTWKLTGDEFKSVPAEADYYVW